MSATQTRQPTGVPTGGQFATSSRAEASIALAPESSGRTRITHLGADDLIELEELLDDVETEYAQAEEAMRDADHDLLVAVHGSRDERTEHAAIKAQASEDLRRAERRRTATLLAVDPQASRPTPGDAACPTTLTGLRQGARDAKAGRVRELALTSQSTAKLDTKLDIAGPRDGTPLHLTVASGFGPVRITGGTVVVRAFSSMGNSITVDRGATVAVIAGAGCKVSTTVEGAGVAVVVGASYARGSQVDHADSEGSLDVV